VCPDGTAEVNATKGRVLLGKPGGGKTGGVYNRPFDAGEVGRSPPHSHAVAANGPGHTHRHATDRPGISLTTDSPGCNSHDENGHDNSYRETDVSKTGISIENLRAKSSIEVSIDANDAGEHLPLVYVLICQEVA
jgi:hypothetical protein